MKRMLAVLAFLALSAVPAFAYYSYSCYGYGTTYTCYDNDGHSCTVYRWGNGVQVYCF